ncbi:hypothetical protein E2I00_011631, partial [Balaenoptera physalus]
TPSALSTPEYKEPHRTSRLLSASREPGTTWRGGRRRGGAERKEHPLTSGRTVGEGRYRKLRALFAEGGALGVVEKVRPVLGTAASGERREESQTLPGVKVVVLLYPLSCPHSCLLPPTRVNMSQGQEIPHCMQEQHHALSEPQGLEAAQ